MFQKLKQNVQFATGAGTHGLLWSEIMPKGIDVGAINTGVQNESICSIRKELDDKTGLGTGRKSKWPKNSMVSGR